MKLKKSEPALLAQAEFVPVYAKENTYPFVFARAAGKDIILAIFNPADREVQAEFKLNISSKKFEKLAGDQFKITQKNQVYSVLVPPISYGIYKVK